MAHSQDDDDDSDLGISTFAEAKQRRKERIAELREGNKGERRLAEVLAQCRKGNRCNRAECPVCERRQKRASKRIPASAVKSLFGTYEPSFMVQRLYLDEVKVIGKRRPLNEEKVRALAASMTKIGLRTPITVRTMNKQVILVSGLHRLAAAQRLKWNAIPCFTIPGGKVEARLWQIAENVYRAELTVLERTEHIDELRVVIWQNTEVGHVAPPGGQQPKDAGINKTAKALGFTKEEIRRSKKIAKISTEAKAEARKLGLDDNQGALLQIAKLPTSNAQVMAIREIDERKRATRARHASAAAAVSGKKATAKIKTIETTITQKTESVGRLNDELAAERKRLRKLQEKLVADCVDTTLIDATSSPSTAPTDHEDIPPIPDSRPLSREDEANFTALTAAWNDARKLRNALAKASEAVREHFIQEVLRRFRQDR
jgi:ParB family chromosome partitioning protein